MENTKPKGSWVWVTGWDGEAEKDYIEDPAPESTHEYEIVFDPTKTRHGDEADAWGDRYWEIGSKWEEDENGGMVVTVPRSSKNELEMMLDRDRLVAEWRERDDS